MPARKKKVKKDEALDLRAWVEATEYNCSIQLCKPGTKQPPHSRKDFSFCFNSRAGIMQAFRRLPHRRPVLVRIQVDRWGRVRSKRGWNRVLLTRNSEGSFSMSTNSGGSVYIPVRASSVARGSIGSSLPPLRATDC